LGESGNEFVTHIQINGVSLEYVDEGTGTPVVFSHGGHSDLRYWQPQREAFAARYRLVTYSRRFHGSSAWPTDGDHSAAAHVTDLVAVMRQLPAGPVHLVGFSTALALQAALRAPGLVRSLTVIEPNVPGLLAGDPQGDQVLAWWRDENKRVTAAAAGDVERGARLWFELVNNRGPGVFDAQAEGLRRMWLDNFGRQRPKAPPPEPLSCEKLSAITTPTLVLAAEYGLPYSRLIVDRLAECLAGCRRVVVPAVTHFMSYQAPTIFNQVVLDFLAQH
jgi:pimeloyl-ACP methyl ester carboxylesterase